MFGSLESERKGRDEEQMRAENRGHNGKILEMKVRLQNVHKMAYIALQKGENINLS